MVFDLDNTLVSSDIDFMGLRQEIGCPQNKDLLLHIAQQKCVKEQQRMHDIVLSYEMYDAQSSLLMPGTKETLEWLKHQNWRVGIVTRNCRQAAKLKLRAHGLIIDDVLTREDFPAKPAPDALIYLMEKWQLTCRQILYVGDHFYDIETAKNAGSLSCFISNSDKMTTENLGHESDFAFSSLIELQRSLQASFTENHQHR
ncbi:hypothetical protein BCU70_00105 [Vibrio sp. 10N.286.49.C2]|uniref:HAD family hydrolase n=1 Tax=unclassified Vibrio TaxID=2614977 RepID=UPI000C858DA9|nr:MULTISPECIES: HAD family hydrolase [unclassified Vibrio]PMH43315.1 hypothetical protein BCU70_00105 [Vibrio sp. 10N.286.49.C2]PMH56967.1 hypothetical protein BCU66_05495 [Vibrio sp. 10N.286.49.B1]PMH81514.1 hypothetical protein BCU58_21165 [Vibrio sp. 10N.286.48.B7]